MVNVDSRPPDNGLIAAVVFCLCYCHAGECCNLFSDSQEREEVKEAST